MSTPHTPPTSPTVRLTIPVSQDVHEAFTKMAEATGMPVGRCMGEWLADTLEGVQFMTSKLVQARQAPRTVIRQMRQELLGVADSFTDALATMKAGPMKAGPMPGAAPAGGARGSGPPRSVIRGGKSTNSGKHATRRKPGV